MSLLTCIAFNIKFENLIMAQGIMTEKFQFDVVYSDVKSGQSGVKW